MKSCVKVFAVLLLGAIILGGIGCAPSEEEIQECYESISKIPISDKYAILSSNMYVSAEETIDFRSLVKDKLKEDGKSVDTGAIRMQRYVGDTALFVCLYKQSMRMGGLNNKNNYYAVGTVSLKDYSVSVKYFRCKYETITFFGMTETHYVIYLGDSNKKLWDKEYDKGYITVSIEDGSVNESEEYPSYSGERKQTFENPTTYVESGVVYDIVGNYSLLWLNQNGESYRIDVPSVYEILEKCDEMKQIADALGGEDKCVYIDTFFFTNGVDLFVGLIPSRDRWFPSPLGLRFPVVFKCDTTLESFEYVGCINTRIDDKYNNVEIIRTFDSSKTRNENTA